MRCAGRRKRCRRRGVVGAGTTTTEDGTSRHRDGEGTPVKDEVVEAEGRRRRNEARQSYLAAWAEKARVEAVLVVVVVGRRPGSDVFI